MRSIIQRVQQSSVYIDGKFHSGITKGVLIFLGIEDEDTYEDIKWLTRKIYQLRIFNDPKGIMNLSLGDIGGQVLVVSQFTLHASIKKGNRPSYIRASKPEFAIPIYEAFINEFETLSGIKVESGVFGGDMKIELVNDGPVTLMIDTKNKE